MSRKEDEAVEVALAPPFSLPGRAGPSVTPDAPRREPSDGDLLQRIGDGDRSAFELLYRRYARAVLGLALRRLGDRGRAEEAVQETFASIWRSASSYRPERARAVRARRGVLRLLARAPRARGAAADGADRD